MKQKADEALEKMKAGNLLRLIFYENQSPIISITFIHRKSLF